MIRSVYNDIMKSFMEYLLFEKKDIKTDSGSKIKSISKDKAKEIGDKIGVDWKKCDLEEFRMGLEVEQEHDTKSKKTDVASSLEQVGKIALAHLKELKNYYTKLKKMEKEN